MRIWKSDLSINQLNQMCHGTLISHLEIEVIEIGDDFIRAKMPVTDHHCQPFGLLHGGASAVLAETLGSIASLLMVSEQEKTPLGKEIVSTHLKPVPSGASVIGEVRKLAGDHKWKITIFDEKSVEINHSIFTSRLKG